MTPLLVSLKKKRQDSIDWEWENVKTRIMEATAKLVLER